MKTALKLLLCLCVTVYLAFAFARLTGPAEGGVCRSIRVSVADTAASGFIEEEEVERLLCEAGISPIGRNMDSVSLEAIDSVLLSSPYIEDVVSYKSPSGCLNVLLHRRRPVVRIFASNGESYYVDAGGARLEVPASKTQAQRVPVATGAIDSAALRSKVLPLVLLMEEDPFWDAQIGQIQLPEGGDVELVPRIGAHVISLGGDMRRLKERLANLRLFYEQVLPVVGWNKYKRINLEYDNQIICTKTT